MKSRFLLVDVFSDKAFGGAKIAVFPEADKLAPEQMQILSSELNNDETVFIRRGEGRALADLKVFAARGEMGVGSHTAVAAAAALFSENKLDTAVDHIPLSQNGQALELFYSQTDKGFKAQLGWKVDAQIDRYTPSAQELQAILGLGEHDIEIIKAQPLFVSSQKPYLIVPLRSLEAVYRAKFNSEAWAQSSASSIPVGDILLYCPETESKQADFHLKLLGPYISQHEDPPIGAAAPAFAAYIREIQKLASGRHALVLERGRMSVRQSILQMEFVHSQTAALSVHIGGHAVVVAEGTIQTP
ncbi:PhzF family phenazine biosynthesis protein [Spongiibacter sp. KMU-158]|uniref:PhzF family phenazine biosynthesis protein n=1 Tax=Spongiibacter pelagi TaxID=2760804 RepID=A0A927C395_9GAMM|nr:PhzF family phenazine biosynthesis isomerase [Spongiibacter pelagi]MBD2859207.1 PhzF family phenazine biosynthesis protein [Spongiibacter pelagi]